MSNTNDLTSDFERLIQMLTPYIDVRVNEKTANLQRQLDDANKETKLLKMAVTDAHKKIKMISIDVMNNFSQNQHELSESKKEISEAKKEIKLNSAETVGNYRDVLKIEKEISKIEMKLDLTKLRVMDNCRELTQHAEKITNNTKEIETISKDLGRGLCEGYLKGDRAMKEIEELNNGLRSMVSKYVSLNLTVKLIDSQVVEIYKHLDETERIDDQVADIGIRLVQAESSIESILNLK